MPEERQARMKNEANSIPRFTENSLPERFDSWVTKTLQYLVFNEIRTIKRMQMSMPEIKMKDMDQMAYEDSYEVDDDAEEVLIGSIPIRIKNKKLAKVLPKIGKRKQQVIVGTIILGIPNRVLAELLGIDERILRNYKSRGLSEIRSRMEGLEDE